MKPSFVLIHSPLTGPMTWRRTAVALEQAGHAALAPSLSGVFDRPAPYYPAFVATVADAVKAAHLGEDIVLVAHSGAGPLVPAITQAIGASVHGAVFVDALLPHPGRSWFDTMGDDVRRELTRMATDGRLSRWNEWFTEDVFLALLPNPAVRVEFVNELPSAPIAYFDEVAPAADLPANLKYGYVQLGEGYASVGATAKARGWPVQVEPLGLHLGMMTNPERLAALLQSFAAGAGLS